MITAMECTCVFVVAGSGAVAIVAGLQNESAAQIRFGSAGGE